MDKKLTAVEWLRENLHLAKDPFTQALELEKEQIIEACQQGFYCGQDMAKTGKSEFKNSKQYYQNTYGNKER